MKIDLRDPSLRETIATILRSCQLSTEYVDNIARCPEQPRQFRPPAGDIDFADLDESDPLFTHIVVKRRIRETVDSFTLRRWLDRNYEAALERYEKHGPMREEITRLRRELVAQHGFLDVRFECGWNETHFRGCLLSFKALADHHPHFMHVLRGAAWDVG